MANKTIEMLKEALEHSVVELNKAHKEDSHKGLMKCTDECKEALSEYNQALRYKQYDAWLECESPIKEAIRMGFVEQFKLKNTAKKDETPNFVATSEPKIFDLIELDAYAKELNKVITVNENWIFGVETLAYWFSKYWTEKIEIKDAISVPACVTDSDVKVSVKKLTSVIQEAMDFICPEIKVQKKDVHYLEAIVIQINGKGALRLPRKETMCKYLTFALHHRFNDMGYSIEKKEK